tara:strand:- start:3290 stop:3832 length:543 start_codon:yes stop_codon:yes gene_type:complete
MTIYYNSNRGVASADSLPKISKGLDSIRSYQFEVEFNSAANLPGTLTNYTLAAKQVGTTGFSVADIEVHRVNDKVFYPGKPNPETLTITFDNLIVEDVSKGLWDWFKGSYNPITGNLGDTEKITSMKVHQLNHDLTLRGSTTYIGVYPTSYKLAEWNYSTSDFHTIEVTFRYDFMEQGTK